MLAYVGRFIVRIANLAEAEGRLAKRELVRLGAAMLWATSAAVIALSGLIAMAIGLFLSLAEVMHPGAAFAIVGALLLVIAAASVFAAKYTLRKS